MTGGIDREAGFKIVAAVEYDIGSTYLVNKFVICQLPVDRGHLDIGIQ